MWIHPTRLDCDNILRGGVLLADATLSIKKPMGGIT